MKCILQIAVKIIHEWENSKEAEKGSFEVKRYSRNLFRIITIDHRFQVAFEATRSMILRSILMRQHKHEKIILTFYAKKH